MTKKTGILWIFIFFFQISVVTGDTYDVTFLGIPVVEVSLRENPESVEPDIREFIFSAKTKPFFSRIFRVNNKYILSMDTSMVRLVEYEKHIDQKNIRQAFKTVYTDQEIMYSSGDRRPSGEPCHTILSLILALTREKEARILSVPLEIEGVFYTATAVPDVHDDHTIEWEIILEEEWGSPVLESTDLFTYRLGDPEAKRGITVNTETGKIVSAWFSLSPYTLTARLRKE